MLKRYFSDNNWRALPVDIKDIIKNFNITPTLSSYLFYFGVITGVNGRYILYVTFRNERYKSFMG